MCGCNGSTSARFSRRQFTSFRLNVRFLPTLRTGRRGVAIAALQRLLNCVPSTAGGTGRLTASRPLQVDERFGPRTLEAVKSFQRSRGLSGRAVDGVVGPQTWTLMAQEGDCWTTFEREAGLDPAFTRANEPDGDVDPASDDGPPGGGSDIPPSRERPPSRQRPRGLGQPIPRFTGMPDIGYDPSTLSVTSSQPHDANMGFGGGACMPPGVENPVPYLRALGLGLG